MKKCIIIFSVVLLLIPFTTLAFANSISSFTKPDSMFEIFDAHITQKYVVDEKYYGYFVADGYSRSGVIALNAALYDTLNEGDPILVQKLKSTNLYSLMKKHQTETYLVDIKKEGNTYTAVINDCGSKKTAKICGNSIEGFVIGQDINLKGSGSDLKVYTDTYQNKWDMISWFLSITVLFVLSGKCFSMILRKYFFYAQMNKET